MQFKRALPMRLFCFLHQNYLIYAFEITNILSEVKRSQIEALNKLSNT
jgi:hypothetical protein